MKFAYKKVRGDRERPFIPGIRNPKTGNTVECYALVNSRLDRNLFAPRVIIKAPQGKQARSRGSPRLRYRARFATIVIVNINRVAKSDAVADFASADRGCCSFLAHTR